jgi:predicted PurR-regulated permease PerM
MKNNLKYLLFGIGIIVVVFGLWYLRSIVAYILIAAVLSLIGRPLINFLDRIRIKNFALPKALSAIITVFVLWLVVYTFFRVFIPLIISQAAEFSKIDVQPLFEKLSDPFQKIEEAYQKLNVKDAETLSLQEYFTNKLVSVLSFSIITDFLSLTAGLIGKLFIAVFAITFITFFFLKDKSLLINGIMMFVPTKYEDQTHHALSSVKRLLTRYFIGIICQVTGIIILVTIGLSIVGLKFERALLIGLVVGIFNVIPYIGPLIGEVLGLLLGVAPNLSLNFYSELLPLMGYMMLVFIIVQVIDNILFQPLIFGTSVKAHPLEVFLVILITAILFGPFAMILAIPAYTVIRVFGKEFFYRYKLVKKLTEHID